MSRRTIARAGGWAAIVGGIVGAASGIALLVVPPAAPPDVFNFPLAPEVFAINQWVFLAHHLVIAFAIWAFWRAGLAGRGRLAATGATLAVGAMTVLAVWEIVAISGTGLPYPGDETAWIDAGYGLCSVVNAIGMILLGVAAARARVLTGPARWSVLAIGVYVFVPNLPLLFAGIVIGRITLSVWMLLFVWLGWGMLRWARAAASDATPNLRRAEVAPA
ncbi:hypothetical protein FLP10_04840 [Agromyces intestinalis]|uniref:DUF998 domain-containing protein n=1 Tax=Agromyces intestinalis TaxID=2592652 RepID=A0A5C1YGE5_9MICO|nr:hypothetical protein [Agromyces intestinalis]QEO13822.1 hypothetical protein FLP10_04840 [Agromyces intestinalis]